jgi:uncharacterized protein YndB with AHSA1/START domain
MALSGNLAVAEQRRYRASREEVFAAFTDPKLIAHWLSPSDEVATEVAELDLRVGGRYRFGFRTALEDHGYVGGAFREITPPERLVFTWEWEPPDPHAGIETIVTVELRAKGGETDLTLTHERFANEGACKRHQEGWTGALGRLEKLSAIRKRRNGK